MTIDVDLATQTVELNIAGRFDAQRLRQLIRELAAARAQVVREPDQPEADAWISARAPLHTSLAKRVGPDGQLALRIPGLGWVGSTLSPRMRTQLLKLLLQQQAAHPEGAPGPIPPAPRPMPRVPPVGEAG
ncbi:hypothetical protein [Piscinibacter sakaiensis]|uniref:Uncharacterized protein n=1 Tax=Piscinibacter sakaiensis TaxID=1547922 RepID=A0A0K8P7U4_PISS1|nr:hypothetical protein [Piscinibacter sakaiensis]GAP38692.1 hypothetical protein ISF6_5245 [Piscinibacter sakaiensis]